MPLLSAITSPRLTDPKPMTDRRDSVRYPVNADTSCPFVLPVQDDIGPARIKDVSTDGIGLMLSRHVEPGTLLALGVKDGRTGQIRTQLVQVAHSTKMAGGGFLVGGTFLTPLTYEELRSMLM